MMTAAANLARFETPAVHLVPSTPAAKKAAKKQSDEGIIAQALQILARRMKQAGQVFGTPTDVKAFCSLQIGSLDHEVFGVVFLDVQNRLIEFQKMFRGTLTQTSVYPREVAKECIRLGAAAVVLTHNHPSGNVQPSRADELLTNTLKTTLALVDVRVLDHIIVSECESLSMVEKGII